MRWLLIGIVLTVVSGLDAQRVADAQPYCAVYDGSPPSCGIPTLQSCQQSLIGVGGVCQPDTTAQQRPDLLGRGRLLRDLQGAPPEQESAPISPGWMPPPPSE